MALTTIDDRGLKTPIDLLDNEKIRFGTGTDLEIYHDGTNSYVEDTGTGDLRLKGSTIRFRSTTGESIIGAFENGAVEIYYDNAKKLGTTSYGISMPVNTRADFNGNIKLFDNSIAYIGTDNDLQIYHDGNSYITNTTATQFAIQSDNLRLRSATDNENYIVCTDEAGVELYYDGTAKLETRSGDVWIKDDLVIQDNDKIRIGTGYDLDIYHDGTHSYIDNTGTGNLYLRETGTVKVRAARFGVDNHGGTETMMQMDENDAVELFYDNSKKFETSSSGIEITGQYTQVANVSNTWAFDLHHDGNDVGRYGANIKCGKDDASGTNYAINIGDGDGSTQGQVTFTGGTVTYGTFTAYHPCIVPNSDNPSDQALAYPYGTLLETISIEYTQKNGANTERGIRYQVQKTQSANSKKVLGAYGGSMNGGPDNHTNQHQALILGDGHILVNNAGGNIEVGDGICSSSTAGIGQKATVNPSMIIGIAQEVITFTGSETKLVAVQYGLQQFIPWT